QFGLSQRRRLGSPTQARTQSKPRRQSGRSSRPAGPCSRCRKPPRQNQGKREERKACTKDDAPTHCTSTAYRPQNLRGIIAIMTNPNRHYPGVAGFDIDDDPPPPGKPTHITKSDSTTVTLRGVPISINSDVGGAFITDLSRNKERLFSDQQVCEKYDISETAWTEITQSKTIRLAVNAEHERRMLRGIASQEAAAKIF